MSKVRLYPWNDSTILRSRSDTYHERYELIEVSLFFSFYYAYDVTEGRLGLLGVKRGTVTCTIAKDAASGPTPA